MDSKSEFRKESPDELIEDLDGYGQRNHAQRTAVDKQALLKEAMQEDPGYSVRSWRFAYFCLQFFLVLCCGGDSGMDATVMSAINSMTQYQKFFGLSAAGSKTGIVFGMYTVGQVAACFSVAYIPDRFGRRVCMVFGNTFLIFGALLTANAQNTPMFLVGRFLTGFGCSTAGYGAKSWAAEILPPHSRGRWLGLLNSFYYVGQLAASGMAIPTGRRKDDYSWRLPLYVQCIPAFINAAGTYLILPESPRWLYARGHKEKAAQILANMHSATRDVNSPLIRLEIAEIEESLALSSRADKRWWDFRPLFNSRPNAYRSLMVFIIGCWGQFSGNGIITYFLTIALGQAGITSPDRQRVLNFVNSVTSFAGALTGSALTDHVGRRKLMLFSMASNTIIMAIIAGLLSNIDSTMRANAGIVFIFLFQVFFSVGFTPLQALYPVEVLNFEVRTKGLSFLNLVVTGFSCINTFALPSAMKAIAWRTYLIFAAVDLVGFVLAWFTAVETKQVTLEEMDSIFEAPNPRKFSTDLAKKVKPARATDAGSA